MHAPYELRGQQAQRQIRARRSIIVDRSRRPGLQAQHQVVPIVAPGGEGGGRRVHSVVEDRGHLRSHDREYPPPSTEGVFDHI